LKKDRGLLTKIGSVLLLTMLTMTMSANVDDSVDDGDRGSKNNSFNFGVGSCGTNGNDCQKCGGGFVVSNKDQCTIGKYSCNNKNACSSSDYVTVLDHSCIGESACNNGDNYDIHNHACIGKNACNNGNDLTVLDNSCYGYAACSSSGNLDIGTDSCIGEEACNKWNILIVGNGSCTGKRSCGGVLLNMWSIGSTSSGGSGSERAKVGTNSCRGEQSCQDSYHFNFGFGHTSNSYTKTVGDNSCWGDKICFNCPYNVPDNVCQNVTDDPDVVKGKCKFCTVKNYKSSKESPVGSLLGSSGEGDASLLFNFSGVVVAFVAFLTITMVAAVLKRQDNTQREFYDIVE